MAFGDMFKKKLGDAALLPEKKFDTVAAPAAAKPEPRPEPKPDKPSKPSRVAATKAAAPAQKTKSGKDYVTDEGMEFNDSEDDSDQYVDKGDGRRAFKPDWADWDKSDLEAFWVKAFALDDAQAKGDDAYNAKLAELGLRNKNHWYRVRETFTVHFQKDAAWQQAMINARMAGTKAAMSAAANAKGGLFDPVEGITLEQYATIQVRRGKLATVEEWPKLLGEYGIDEAKWAQVDKVFMGRMSDPSDMMATAAFATEYGKFFSAASSGQFAAGAKAGAAAMGLESAHTEVNGAAEPVRTVRALRRDHDRARMLGDRRQRRQRHAEEGLRHDRDRLEQPRRLLEPEDARGRQHRFEAQRAAGEVPAAVSERADRRRSRVVRRSG